MPHAVYFDPFILCPWSGCGLRIEVVDFRIEDHHDPARYSRIVGSWQLVDDYSVIARCPGCSRYVRFGRGRKEAVAEPLPPDTEVLPDNWHTIAFIA